MPVAVPLRRGLLSWLSGVAGVLVLPLLDLPLFEPLLLLPEVDLEPLLELPLLEVVSFGIESFLVRLSFGFRTMVSAGDFTVSIGGVVVSAGFAMVSAGTAVESAFGSSVLVPHDVMPDARKQTATNKARDFINRIPSDVSICMLAVRPSLIRLP